MVCWLSTNRMYMLYMLSAMETVSVASPSPSPTVVAPSSGRVNPISPIMPPTSSPQRANANSAPAEGVEEIAQKMEQLSVLKAQLEERKRQLGNKVSPDGGGFGSVQMNATSPLPPSMVPPSAGTPASPMGNIESFWGPQAIPQSRQVQCR